MQSRLLLDIVVGQSAAILQLLASENQTLLIRWNTLLVLNLGLETLDSIGGLDVKSDSLTGKGLDEDLHGSVYKECRGFR